MDQAICISSAIANVGNIIISIIICWPLPSNQSFYKQIVSYGEGVGHHNYYGRPMMKGDIGQQNSYQT